MPSSTSTCRVSTGTVTPVQPSPSRGDLSPRSGQQKQKRNHCTLQTAPETLLGLPSNASNYLMARLNLLRRGGRYRGEHPLPPGSPRQHFNLGKPLPLIHQWRQTLNLRHKPVLIDHLSISLRPSRRENKSSCPPSRGHWEN